MGILGSFKLPPTADANDDSIQPPPSDVCSFAHWRGPRPEGQTLDFLSSVQDRQTPSGSSEQDLDTSLPLPSSPSSIPSDSPQDAAEIANTTSDQQVKADDIQVLMNALPEILHLIIGVVFSAFPQILQCILGVVIVAASWYLRNEYNMRRVVNLVIMLVIGAVLYFVLYDMCIYIQDDIILVQ